jgi:hypothetical protein
MPSPGPRLFHDFRNNPQTGGPPLVVRMDLVEVGWGDADWIGLAQDRDRSRALVNSVLNLRVP